ncbi:MAG: cytochrome C oxidase subunit IV family protein [Anaerolineae bacterium]|nr:cytochrome C oxidase subunit IV family protein [Anaerolineae bacterium]
MADQHHEEHGEHGIHITPVSTYLMVFAGLMVLLALTLFVGYTNFGAFDKSITVAVAIVKASLIMYFFMHLRHSSGLVWVFGVLGFFFFIIMLLIGMGDYAARGTIQGPL